MRCLFRIISWYPDLQISWYLCTWGTYWYFFWFTVFTVSILFGWLSVFQYFGDIMNWRLFSLYSWFINFVPFRYYEYLTIFCVFWVIGDILEIRYLGDKVPSTVLFLGVILGDILMRCLFLIYRYIFSIPFYWFKVFLHTWYFYHFYTFEIYLIYITRCYSLRGELVSLWSIFLVTQ